MKSSREISQFHFTNFIQRCSRCWLSSRIWVNIDPVNMCAVHTLPPWVFFFFSEEKYNNKSHPPCSQRGSQLSEVSSSVRSEPSRLPQGHCGKGTTVASGWHICSLRQAKPPGSSHALASVSRASLITTLVSPLIRRQRAVTGATRLQI